MADDERRGSDEQLRKSLGLVLLDLDDGERDAVGLQGWHGEWDSAKNYVATEFQLFE